MANSGTGTNIWILDTAATIKAKGLMVGIKLLRFYPNATDNDLKVTDSLGNIIWEIRATVPSPNKESVGVLETEPYEIYNGFILETIDGGVLHVHSY